LHRIRVNRPTWADNSTIRRPISWALVVRVDASPSCETWQRIQSRPRAMENTQHPTHYWKRTHGWAVCLHSVPVSANDWNLNCVSGFMGGLGRIDQVLMFTGIVFKQDWGAIVPYIPFLFFIWAPGSVLNFLTKMILKESNLAYKYTNST